MPSFLFRSVAAALLGVALAPAAFGQPSDQGKPGYHPYASAGRAPVCSELELRAGLTGADCGRLSATEIGRKGRE